MTATIAPGFARPRRANSARVEAALVTTGLGAVVLARAAATRAGLEPVIVGAAFGIALVGLAIAGGIGARGGGIGARVGARMLRALVVGAIVGLGFVVAAAAGAGTSLGAAAHPAGLARPAGAFLPWAAVTLIVAIAEEAILRGLLFSRIRDAGGSVLAVLATTAVFALMHVPLYGWHVVPLDLAVGLGLGGLRIATRGFAAPAAAHAVADLATWWL